MARLGGNNKKRIQDWTEEDINAATEAAMARQAARRADTQEAAVQQGVAKRTRNRQKAEAADARASGLPVPRQEPVKLSPVPTPPISTENRDAVRTALAARRAQRAEQRAGWTNPDPTIETTTEEGYKLGSALREAALSNPTVSSTFTGPTRVIKVPKKLSKAEITTPRSRVGAPEGLWESDPNRAREANAQFLKEFPEYGQPFSWAIGPAGKKVRRIKLRKRTTPIGLQDKTGTFVWEDIPQSRMGVKGASKFVPAETYGSPENPTGKRGRVGEGVVLRPGRKKFFVQRGKSGEVTMGELPVFERSTTGQLDPLGLSDEDEKKEIIRLGGAFIRPSEVKRFKGNPSALRRKREEIGEQALGRWRDRDWGEMTRQMVSNPIDTTPKTEQGYVNLNTKEYITRAMEMGKLVITKRPATEKEIADVWATNKITSPEQEAEFLKKVEAGSKTEVASEEGMDPLTPARIVMSRTRTVAGESGRGGGRVRSLPLRGTYKGALAGPKGGYRRFTPLTAPAETVGPFPTPTGRPEPIDPRITAPTAEQAGMLSRLVNRYPGRSVLNQQQSGVVRPSAEERTPIDWGPGGPSAAIPDARATSSVYVDNTNDYNRATSKYDIKYDTIKPEVVSPRLRVQEQLAKSRSFSNQMGAAGSRITAEERAEATEKQQKKYGGIF